MRLLESHTVRYVHISNYAIFQIEEIDKRRSRGDWSHRVQRKKGTVTWAAYNNRRMIREKIEAAFLEEAKSTNALYRA